MEFYSRYKSSGNRHAMITKAVVAFVQRSSASAVAVAMAVGLAGCVGGTTYGTGVTQEKQTLNDVYNMFTLKNQRKNIDYSARPDLVVPENTASLPEPLDSEVTTSNPDWPETPEQRIARIRAQAGEIDARSGEYSLEEQLREKEGIGIETQERQKFVVGQTDRDGNPILFNGEASQARRESVLARKAELEPSRGASRKYLTEPPVEYRIPADTAPAGAEAYSEEEIAERERKKKEAEERDAAGLLSRD